MSIRVNKASEEVAFIDSILLSIDECQTGYDIFVVLKILLKFYHFEYFMISKLDRQKGSTAAFEILITNWSPEYLMEFNERIYSTKNKTITSLIKIKNPCYVDFQETFSQTQDQESIEILNFLLRSGRRLTAMIPVTSNKGVTSNIAFTKNDANKDTTALIELTYFANLIFDRLLIVGHTSAIVECPLIEREIQCIRLLADGAKLKKIAELMAISVHTVSYHLNNAEKKLNAKSKVNLIATAIRSDWID